jgi:hypothetical protein
MYVGMLKVSKNGRIVMLRDKAASMLSGAAMITFDHRADMRFVQFACNGMKRDADALHSDYVKALRGAQVGNRKRERESAVG